MAKRKDVLEIITILGIELSDVTEEIVNLLKREGTLDETYISEKLELKINAVRKILYALSELGVVHYTKKKHPEKKWWYVYSWVFDEDKVFEKYIEFLEKQLQEKEEILADKSISFICKKCDRKIEYSDALVCDFRCTRCDSILKEVKSKDAKLEREIKKLKKEISEYSE